MVAEGVGDSCGRAGSGGGSGGGSSSSSSLVQVYCHIIKNTNIQ